MSTSLEFLTHGQCGGTNPVIVADVADQASPVQLVTASKQKEQPAVVVVSGSAPCTRAPPKPGILI